MSEQDGTQSSTKQRRNRKTSTTPQESGKQALSIQHPANDDNEAWKAYWKAQGQPWRTEPEIDAERQRFLDERRAITPDIKEAIYPFKEIKLSRADVEWLLATHENGRGPVDWSDEKSLRERRGLDLRGADLRQINLMALPLSGTRGGLNQEERIVATADQYAMAEIHLEGAFLRKTHLERADLFRAHLEGTNLYAAYLKKAYLRGAHLEGADLYAVDLYGGHLREAHLEGTDLRRAQLEKAELADVFLSDEKQIGPRLVDADWNHVNLSVIKWSQVYLLGDEYQAQQKRRDGQVKNRNVRLEEYERAVRANRQLAVALQTQGLNEEADHFAYRAQLLQRTVWRLQRRPLKLLLSWFLFLLAGYGYRPLRSLIAYLVIVLGFMSLYLLNAHFVTPHLRWDEALVLSVSSFHGRGFFSQDISLGDTYARLAAGEAIVGLFIEISFIATFTQRFFGR